MLACHVHELCYFTESDAIHSELFCEPATDPFTTALNYSSSSGTSFAPAARTQHPLSSPAKPSRACEASRRWRRCNHPDEAFVSYDIMTQPLRMVRSAPIHCCCRAMRQKILIHKQYADLMMSRKQRPRLKTHSKGPDFAEMSFRSCDHFTPIY